MLKTPMSSKRIRRQHSTNQTTVNDMKWGNVSAVPIMIDSEIVKFNNKEFIAAHSTFGLFKYNIFDNKWRLFATYPIEPNYNSQKAKLLIDHDNKQLYILSDDKHTLITFNTETKIFNKFDFKKIQLFVGDEAYAPSLIMIKHKMNIINDNKICAWDNNKHKLKLVDKINLINDAYFGGYGSVYLSLKQSILFIGGSCFHYPYEWTTNNMYLYNTNNGKVSKTNNTLPIPLAFFGYVLTRNQKYVVIFGGIIDDKQEKTDDIYILNTDMMTFRKSVIKCPCKDSFQAILFCDEHREQIITFGFIRQCWKSKQFLTLQYPPNYICQLINQWFVDEYVHLIAQTTTFNQRNHFKIKFDCIFNP
eukprot:166312_1